MQLIFYVCASFDLAFVRVVYYITVITAENQLVRFPIFLMFDVLLRLLCSLCSDRGPVSAGNVFLAC